MKKILLIINPTSGGEKALDYKVKLENKARDYFEDLKNDFTYQKLEICYYQALNAKIKGQVNKSKELFSKLAQEEQELYIVKKAKEFLYC